MTIYLIKRRPRTGRNGNRSILCNGTRVPETWYPSGYLSAYPPIMFISKRKAKGKIKKLEKARPDFEFSIYTTSHVWW